MTHGSWPTCHVDVFNMQSGLHHGSYVNPVTGQCSIVIVKWRMTRGSWPTGHVDVFNMQSGLHRGSYVNPVTGQCSIVSLWNYVWPTGHDPRVMSMYSTCSRGYILGHTSIPSPVSYDLFTVLALIVMSVEFNLQWFSEEKSVKGQSEKMSLEPCLKLTATDWRGAKVKWQWVPDNWSCDEEALPSKPSCSSSRNKQITALGRAETRTAWIVTSFTLW